MGVRNVSHNSPCGRRSPHPVQHRRPTFTDRRLGEREYRSTSWGAMLWPKLSVSARMIKSKAWRQDHV